MNFGAWGDFAMLNASVSPGESPPGCCITRSLFFFRPDRRYRIDDILIPRAAADVAFDALADLRFGGLGIARQNLIGGENHPRGAEPALKSVFFPKLLLDGVEFSLRSEPFDGGDLSPVRLDGEDGAAFHGLSVKKNGARAANRGLTADVRSSKSRVVAQQMDQQGSGLDVEGADFAVDAE